MFKRKAFAAGIPLLLTGVICAASIREIYLKPYVPQGEFILERNFYSNVYYTEKDYEYAQTVKRLGDMYVPVFVKDFELDSFEKPVIYIYPDKNSLYEAIGVDYMDKPPMGVYYKGAINILSPDNWVPSDADSVISEKFIEEGPILHEMAHFFLDIKTNGNYEVWFSEGIALYWEYKYMGYEWRQDLSGVSEDISIHNMKKYFSESPDGEGYRCAFEQICAITADYGENALTDIFESLAKGIKLKDILELYY